MMNFGRHAGNGNVSELRGVGSIPRRTAFSRSC